MENLTALLKKLGTTAVKQLSSDFNFFTDDSSEGIFSKEEYRSYISSLEPWEIRHLKSLHDNMRLNRKLNSEPTLEYDNGKEHIWCRFGYGNLRQNLRIRSEGRMFDFIKDYTLGKIKNVKSLEDLLTEVTQ